MRARCPGHDWEDDQKGLPLSALPKPNDEEDNDELDGRCECVVKVPQTEEFLMPLLNVVPLQLLAYHFPMLADEGRNGAFHRALTVAIGRFRAAHGRPPRAAPMARPCSWRRLPG